MKLSKSFKKGFLNILNLYVIHNDALDFSDGFAKDKEALKGDWNNVGQDIRIATSKLTSINQ